MAIEVTDEMICRLTQEWVATLPAQYPEPEHPHRFSLRFYRMMRPILRQARRNEAASLPLRGGRLATAFLAAALLTATVAMAVPAVREKVFQMVREVYERYSHIYYEQTDGDTPFEEFVPYHITYIPEGFTIAEERTTNVSHKELFKNEAGELIALDQTRIDREAFSIDTENVEPEEVILGDNQTAWYLGNKTLKIVYWNDGVYSFVVSGHTSKEELLKISNNISK